MTFSAADLRLQLLPLDRIEHGATDTLREAGGGLVTRLVQRIGDGGVAVPRDEASANLGDDWYDVAAEQTYRQELAQADVRDHTAADVTFRMIAIDGSPLVSTALLWADTIALFPGMTDALVCAPRFSTAIVRPVLGQADIGAARTLFSVVRTMTADAVDPCSDGVFWWRSGTFHRIDFDEQTHEPILPAELGPVASALPR